MGIPSHPQQSPVKIKIKKSCPLFFFHIAVTIVCKLFLLSELTKLLEF